MRLLTVSILAITLSTGALAQGWHGCAAGFSCNTKEECRNQEDCKTTAGGVRSNQPSTLAAIFTRHKLTGSKDLENIYCGQANHPYACWAYYPTAN
ncbi:hypothetical protein ETB97_003211 [Aspergillus alliaceus]|uniref:Uncharacterized protein n=1 Tax=Petromyces alliaceus TaxID=209559 RepID=A0A8H6A4G9_PETAA|nr:hypothetical protein ETB97_003211 [Aspergillus burnettii]